MLKIFYFMFIFSLSCLTLQAQNSIKVKGTVVDYLSSKPVKNVLISVKNTLTSATASDNGKFTVEVRSPYSVLVVSFPGYQTKEYSLNGRKEVSIVLVPDGVDAGESIVRLPYSTSNTKDLNGAYTVIQNNNDRYRDIYQMLQGTVPGLESNAYSGVPGEGVKFNLRGTRSLFTNNEPLIVLDGTPINNLTFNNSIVRGNQYNYLSDINVKDIESITVLRDASAAGIYGTHAANGAIAITTKGGTNGKTFLDVSVQTGVSSRFKEIPMMNSAEYLPFLSGKLYGQGMSYQNINDNFPFFSMNTSSTAYLPYSNNTDWQKEITRNANNVDFHLNLRGGDATSKYAFNVGYNNSQGSIKETSSSSFTSRFNLDFKILKNFSAGTRISFSTTTKKLMDQGYDERVNPLYLSLVKPPIFSPYIQISQGVYSQFLTQPSYDNLSNPMAVITGVSNDVRNYWILANVYAQYNFSRNLTSKLTISIDRRGLQEDRFTPAYGIAPLNLDLRYDRTAEKQIVNRQVITIEHTLNFEKELAGGNRIQAFAGYNLEVAKYSTGYGFARHSTDDQYKDINNGTRVTSDGLEEKYDNVSAFVNGEYAFRQKLFLKAGVRMDGSSKFGKDAEKGIMISSVPFAVLPYTGLTWKVKSEPWMNKINFLSELNLRTSWGMTANQDIPVNAQYTVYDKVFNGPYTGMALNFIGNSAIKWETTKSYNAGADISFLKNTLNFTIDYFDNRTEDLLVPKSIAGVNGQTFYWTNEGTIRNTGIEISAGTRGHLGNFIWSFSANIAKYKNKILSLPNGVSLVDGINGYTSIAKVGSPAGLIYGFKYEGVFNTSAAASASGLKNDKGIAYQAGDYRFADLNGDGYINDLDRMVIGNSNPDFFGGITTNLTYKNFSLDAVFSYSYGNEILNVLRSKLENGSAYENQSATILTRWMGEGDIASIANTPYGDPDGNRRPSSRYIEDGSYFKMRTLTVTYNVNNKIGFARTAQVYLTGYNLFTLTNYTGLDPEISIGQNAFSRGYDFGNVPQTRSFMLGIKIGL